MIQRNKIIIIILSLIISFFIFHHSITIGMSFFETISSSLLYPFLRIQHVLMVPINQWMEQKKTLQALKNEVELFRIQNEKLRAENIQLQALALYASETNELQKFNAKYNNKGIVAQILAKHFSPSGHFFLIDAGLSQGIKKDMIAIYCNTIIGKVVEVYPWYCKVCLITDADCKIAAVCLSHQNIPSKGVRAIHEGSNTFSTILRYVSHLESINVNDIVYSSGEGLIFPQGFALGTVTKAEKGELFYTIMVEPLLDLKKMTYCMLIAREDI